MQLHEPWSPATAAWSALLWVWTPCNCCGGQPVALQAAAKDSLAAAGDALVPPSNLCTTTVLLQLQRPCQRMSMPATAGPKTPRRRLPPLPDS